MLIRYPPFFISAASSAAYFLWRFVSSSIGRTAGLGSLQSAFQAAFSCTVRQENSVSYFSCEDSSGVTKWILFIGRLRESSFATETAFRERSRPVMRASGCCSARKQVRIPFPQPISKMSPAIKASFLTRYSRTLLKNTRS